MLQFSILLFLIFNSNLVIGQQTTSINAVYSPFYLNKIDFQDNEGVPLKIQVAKQVDLVFVSTGFNGLLVINSQGQDKLFQAPLGNNYINSFDVTSNGRFIILGLKSEISIYEFINPLNNTIEKQSFVEVGSKAFPTEVQDIIYLESQNITVAVGMLGEVVVYDVYQMDKINILANYNTQSLQITGVSISDDGKWIYLGCDIVGVVVLKLNIIESINPNTQQNERQGELLLAAKGMGYRKSWSVIATHDFQYIFEIENWFGIFYAPFSHVVSSNQDKYPIELSFQPYWPFSSISPTCYVLMVSSDNKLLFVGARSQGIFIFDISKPNNFRFYQQIKVDALAMSVTLSKTEQYLYFSNSLSVYTFVRNKPNLNNEFPNIFNTHQAFQFDMEGIYKWRCYIDPTNNYIIGAFDYSGFYIIPFYQDPYKLDPDNAIRLDIEADSAQLDSNNKYLYIPSLFSKKLLTVYQIKPDDDDPQNSQNISITNPKEVYQYNIDTVYMSEQIIFSKDRQYAIITYSTGLLLFNSSNPLKFELTTYWLNPSFMHGENQGAIITKDNNWILSTIRSYGIYALDASNKNNLVLTDYIETRGGEGIEISQIYDYYAYFTDGIKGFAIIDLRSLPQINIISRVQLPGWTQIVQLLKQEQYILVGSMEDGMLTLIDIKNKKKPKIISSYRKDKQYVVSMCIPHNQEFVFMSNPQGIIALPLVSRIMIHTEVNEIIMKAGNNITVKFDQQQALLNTTGLEENDFVFKVGQIIQLSFVILYPEVDMRIAAVNIYENYQVYNLHYYMVFDFSFQTLIMKIDKQLLSSERENVQLNTILIQTFIPLSAQSFVFTANDNNDKAITSHSQAQLMLDYLQQVNILDDKNTLLFGFNPNKQQIFDEGFLKNKILTNVLDQDFDKVSKKLTKKVKIVLIQSSFINPVVFYVKPSLFFYIDYKTPYIESLSKSVSIEIQADIKDGQFYFQNYIGVIQSSSDEQDYLRLEGQIEVINKILLQKIIFANKTTIDMNNPKNSTQKIQITISDNINYPITFTRSINRCNFIVLKQQLQQNPELSLQFQVNRMYSDSIVSIESEVSIIFAENSFIASDAQGIKYQSAYTTSDIDDESSYKEITPEFWLQPESENKCSYRGSVSSANYLKVYHFRVNATDGHTYSIGKFTLKIYGVPFSYIFNLLLKILGPFFAAIGIYQKRYIILNMIFRNSVQFDDEIIECNLPYTKKIILIGKTLHDSKILTNLLFAKVEQQFGKKQKISNSDNEIPQSNISMTDLHHPYSQTVTFNNEEVIKKVESERLRVPIKLPKISNIKKTIALLDQQKAHIPIHPIEKLYLKQNGSICMSKIIKDLISANFTTTHVRSLSASHSYAADLKNVNSRIYRGIRAQSSRQLLLLDKRSQIVYEFVKQYTYNNLHKSQNDWYKAIVYISDIQETDQNGILITFPQLSIICENFLKILIELKLFSYEDQERINNYNKIIKESVKRRLNINFFLIREVLYGDALGFSSFIPSILQPAVGESIHLNTHEIKHITAFKKGNYKKWVRCFMKFFNLEYNKYGVSKNIRLPTWLQLDQKHGVLIFQGIPTTEDIEEVLIRIYDISGYVIKQFILKVIESQNKNNIKDDSVFSIPNENDFEQTSFSQKQQRISYSIRASQDKREYFKKNRAFKSSMSPDQTCTKLNSDLNSFDTLNLQQISMMKPKGKEPINIQLYNFLKNDNNKNIIEESLNESKAKNNFTNQANTLQDTNDFVIEGSLQYNVFQQQNDTQMQFDTHQETKQH